MYAATSLGRKLGLRDSIFSGLRHGEYPGTKVTLGPEISALAGAAAAFSTTFPSTSSFGSPAIRTSP
jgi:hypothetical protein